MTVLDDSRRARPEPASQAESASQAEPDQILDHEYDGIQEYDNPMPGWWKSLFIASVIFSGLYVFWFHVAGRGQSAATEYAADVAQASALLAEQAIKEKPSEAALAQLKSDAPTMQSAALLYEQRCRQCHDEQGRGNIGPNLTDNHWIHGRGNLMDIYKTVSEGVLEKGMPAWNKQLSPTELKQIVAFVGTLRGRNLPGKAPEGELVP